MFIFVIGPWGVGKSTSGYFLAEALKYKFIDLDTEFTKNIWNITTYIRKKWYENYCIQNSNLFYKIIDKTKEKSIFVLSSGFLVHENMDNLTEKHKKSIQKKWISILLLPSKSKKESTDIVIKRQLSRGFWLNEEKERLKFIKRFGIYKDLWDIKIFSYKEPKDIAKQMEEELRKILQ